ALLVLSALWEACESLGLLPKQLKWIPLPVLPKPAGATSNAWTLAARTKAAVSSNMPSVTLVTDYSKYYEEVDLDALQYKFDNMKAPTGFAMLGGEMRMR
ncbi:unnamed protein product, partial [Prorocentrum cordatum]